MGANAVNWGRGEGGSIEQQEEEEHEKTIER